MEFDIIIIGGGAAGEAAADTAANLGARAVLIERELVGGECSFWACMPSKALLNSAAMRAGGGNYPWQRASERRDWMISREHIAEPDDSSHVKGLEDSGVRFIRGAARITGKGRVEVDTNKGPRETLEAKTILVATGSVNFIPPIDGLADVAFWTNREATSLRELPSSILIMGGGAVGVEMAQVYTRFGVTTTLIEGNERIMPRDHPLSSKAVTKQLEHEGATIITGVKAVSVAAGGKGRRVTLSDGRTLEAAELLVAVGRRPADLRALGIEEAGASLDDKGNTKHDASLRINEGLFIAGDCAGGLQFTHVADYEGRIATRTALGQRAVADLTAVPKATFTDPEVGAVGLTLEEARSQGHVAFEQTQDFRATAKGYSIEGSHGHVTAVVDKERKILLGAFAACPGAGELISEAVLAIKQNIPLDVLADTIHAFPTASRVFMNVISEALKQT